MSSKVVTWGIVGLLAALFIYWQYSNYAHNSQLNSNLSSPDLKARVAAASELIDKKQFGDVLPTTLPPVHDKVIPALAQIASATGNKDRSTEALNQLVGLMKDSDEKVRDDAQAALIGLGNTAIPGVTTALGDGDAHARKGAIAVLDKIGDRAVIKALVDAIQKTPGERSAAVDALVGMAPAPTPDMLKLLGNKDKDVQSAAANYFGNTASIPGKKQTQGEDKLLALLQNKGVRPAAMRAEGLLRDVHAQPEIVKALTAPADSTNRRTAIVALGDMRAISTIPAIIPFLQSDDPDIRSVAVASLHTMGAAAVPALKAVYASGDPVTRRGIADSLWHITSPDTIALLTQALHDPDSGVRQSAAVSLGGPNNDAAVGPLVAALKDPDTEVAETAQASLGEIGAPAVKPLVDALAAGGSIGPGTGDTSALVAADYASGALATIGPDAAPDVIRAATSGPESGRAWAIVTLGDLRTDASEKALNSILDSGNPTLKPFALEALRHYQA